MNSPPSGDEGLHIIPRDKPAPRLLATAASPAVPKPPPKGMHPALRILGIALAVIAGLGLAGIIYEWRRESSVPVRPMSVLKTIRQALPTPPRAPLDVGSDSLHVTAIALGEVRLALVNGKQLAEGDWLEVRTSDGVAALRVARIQDGVVEFGYGGKTIEARLMDQSQKPPH